VKKLVDRKVYIEPSGFEAFEQEPDAAAGGQKTVMHGAPDSMLFSRGLSPRLGTRDAPPEAPLFYGEMRNNPDTIS
jgi:hypothetical protein